MKLFVRGYHGAGFGSGAIKWFTRSKYSHVSLVFHLHGDAEEIEAIQGSGVIRHRPFTDLEKTFDEYAVPISEDQIIEAHILAMSLLGARYDWAGVYAFLLRRSKHSLDKFFCSEFVTYILLKIAYPVSRRLPYKHSPDTVMESYRLIAPVAELGGA